MSPIRSHYPRDHPLLGMDNVVIAPHLGSATRKTRIGMVTRTIENLIAGLTGAGTCPAGSSDTVLKARMFDKPAACCPPTRPGEW